MYRMIRMRMDCMPPLILTILFILFCSPPLCPIHPVHPCWPLLVV